MNARGRSSVQVRPEALTRSSDSRCQQVIRSWASGSHTAAADSFTTCRTPPARAAASAFASCVGLSGSNVTSRRASAPSIA